MTDYQATVWKMIQEIIKFFRDNPELLASNAPLKAHVDMLEALAKEIEKYLKQQQVDFRGLTIDKNKAKALLAIMTYQLSGSLRSYSTDIGSSELFKEVNKSKSTIRAKLKDVDAVAYIGFIIDMLRQYSKEVEQYGTTKAMTDELENDLNSFQKLLLLPAQKRKEVKLATDNIKLLLSDGRKLLRLSIDNDMLQYQQTQAEIYRQYDVLREIDDSQTAHTPLYGRVLDEETKLAIQAGAVTVIRMAGIKEEIIATARTGDKGYYRCRFKEFGMMKARFQCPGYDQLEITVRIFENKGTRLNVEIRKTE